MTPAAQNPFSPRHDARRPRALRVCAPSGRGRVVARAVGCCCVPLGVLLLVIVARALDLPPPLGRAQARRAAHLGPPRGQPPGDEASRGHVLGRGHAARAGGGQPAPAHGRRRRGGGKRPCGSGRLPRRQDARAHRGRQRVELGVVREPVPRPRRGGDAGHRAQEDRGARGHSNRPGARNQSIAPGVVSPPHPAPVRDPRLTLVPPSPSSRRSTPARPPPRP
jgi:hypothetical protein